jgi:hypothetical protein
VLAQRALEVVVDAFALERVATEQVVGEHSDLGVRGSITADVLADQARVGAN